jgi:hypothetical protein
MWGALFALFAPVFGDYSLPVEVKSPEFREERLCAAEGGRWEAGRCLVGLENNIAVKAEGDGGVALSIYLIGDEYAECNFSALGEVRGQNVFARVELSESGPFCEVKLTWVGEKVVNLSNNGNCAALCDAGMSLEADGFTIVSP